ncbi:MAG: PilN domain-containing protein [Candidatus Methylacidiphilales bacterium]
MSLRESKRLFLIFPGREQWELWSFEEAPQTAKSSAPAKLLLLGSSVAQLLPGHARGAALHVAIPVIHTFVASIVLPEASKSEIVHAAALEAERLGLFEARSADDSVWDWRMAPHETVGDPLGNNRRVTIVALPRQIPEELVVAEASHFSPSFEYLYLGNDGLILWKELGRLIIGVIRRRQMVHAQPLTDGLITPAALNEIRCLHFQMEASGLIEPQTSLSLAGEFSDENVSRLEQQLGLGVTRISSPVPRLPSKALELTPLEVVSAREGRRKNRFRFRVALSVVVIYVTALAVWLGWLYQLDKQVEAGARELEMTSPHAMEAMAITRRWYRLESVLDARRDPVTILKGIVESMPPEGLRMTMYLQKGNDILIEGECRSSLVAVDFSKKLKSLPQLKGVEWMPEIPQPQRNSTMYRFVIKGRMEYASLE